jgi:hypothetical protein
MTKSWRSIVLVLLFASQAYPYSFGKNKIQYQDFDWRIVKTEHFDIYHYEGGSRIAQFAASVLERTYARYDELLKLEDESRIPVILYNCPSDFQQTNVTLQLIDEGTQGMTELFKNRVVLPFMGSYSQFEHVLAHELVHVFQFKILIKGLRSPTSITSLFTMPLWVMEGMAEYLSEGWSDEADVFMRDLVVNDLVVSLSDLEYYGGYLIYKQGQAIYRFIDEKYGSEKIREFFYNVKFQRNTSIALKKTFGKDIDEFSKDFESHLKQLYYPLVGEFAMPASEKRLTNHLTDGGFMNVAPAITPEGNQVAIISDRKGFTDIYLLSSFDGKVMAKLVSGGRTPSLEYLHLFRPGLSFSPDGKKLAFAAQGNVAEMLHIVDIDRRRIDESYRIELDAVYTPSWAPDGNSIAFVGLQDGASDIYILDIPTGEVDRLLDDYWDERDPRFSPDGSSLVFVSDRYDGTSDSVPNGSYAVFTYGLESGELERITPHLGEVASPDIVDDSLVSFIGDLNGSSNIIVLNTKTDSFYTLTRYLTAVSTTSWSADRRKLTYSLLWEGGEDVYLLSNPLSKLEPVSVEEVEPQYVEIEPYADLEKKDYGLNLSVDWVQGALEFSVPFGVYGAMTFAVSDALGNHRFALTSDLFSDLSNSNFELSYLFLPKRIDLGAALYQYWNFYPLTTYGDVIALEKRLGIQAVSYIPLDKFKRIELSIGYEKPTLYTYVDMTGFGDYYMTGKTNHSILSLYGGFVIDDALYGYMSPIDGHRVFIGGDKTFFSSLDYYTLLGDFRKYFRISPRSTFATKLMLGYSGGEDALPFWLGGPNTIRGHEYYSMIGTRMVLLNAELRVPFLDYMKLSFPLPIELGGIQGVLFFDVGNTWFADETFTPVEEGGHFYKLKDLNAGFGAGMRLSLGFANLKFDIAKKTDLYDVSTETFYYFTIGTDF